MTSKKFVEKGFVLITPEGNYFSINNNGDECYEANPRFAWIFHSKEELEESMIGMNLPLGTLISPFTISYMVS